MYYTQSRRARADLSAHPWIKVSCNAVGYNQQRIAVPRGRHDPMCGVSIYDAVGEPLYLSCPSQIASGPPVSSSILGRQHRSNSILLQLSYAIRRSIISKSTPRIEVITSIRPSRKMMRVDSRHRFLDSTRFTPVQHLLLRYFQALITRAQHYCRGNRTDGARINSLTIAGANSHHSIPTP
jgi:hypothetical protein